MPVFKDGQAAIPAVIGQFNADNLNVNLEGVAVQSFLYGYDSGGGNWDRVTISGGALSVDTELAAAILAADDMANMTVPQVLSNLMGYDSSTWDRLTTSAAGDNPGGELQVIPNFLNASGTFRWRAAENDGVATTVVPNVVGMLYNASTCDRMRTLAQPNTITGRTLGTLAVGQGEGKATYRIAFKDLAAVAGVAVRLAGNASNTVRVTKVQIAKPSAAQAPLRMVKTSAAATGGSATTPTPISLDSADGVAASVLSLYTAAPTGGTEVGTGSIYESDIGVSDVLFETFGDEQNTQALVLRGTGENLEIDISADATLNGFLEWTEE